jgi:hypothetical protein
MSAVLFILITGDLNDILVVWTDSFVNSDCLEHSLTMVFLRELTVLSGRIREDSKARLDISSLVKSSSFLSSSASYCFCLTNSSASAT